MYEKRKAAKDICCMSCAGLSWWGKVMRRKKKISDKKFVILQAIGDILLGLIGF